jgi:hypothetical protein
MHCHLDSGVVAGGPTDGLDSSLSVQEELDPDPEHAQPDTLPDTLPDVLPDAHPDTLSRLDLWEVQDILSSIHETIDWLHRLSNLVRKASTASQNEKSTAFVLTDEFRNDITDVFCHIYIYRTVM